MPARSETIESIRRLVSSNRAIDKTTVDEFISKLHFRGDAVSGFYYGGIKPKLSNDEWLALLKLVNFDPAKQGDWDSFECNGRSCQPNFNHACDNVTCGH